MRWIFPRAPGGGRIRRARAFRHALAALFLLGAPEAVAQVLPLPFNPPLAVDRSGPPTNLSVSASLTSSAGRPLYPGATGDVQITIENPNRFPVTVTAIILPGDSNLAAGFRDAQLKQPEAGCGAANSEVMWSDATARPSVHLLDQPLTVGPRTSRPGALTVRLTGAATMGSDAPEACADTYFALPALAGVQASSSLRPPTPSPTVDRWMTAR